MPGPQIVRWEIEPLERPRRGIDERIALAAPWLRAALARRAERQAAGAKLRRSVITRAVRVGFAANNRRDYEAMAAAMHPDVEVVPPSPGEGALGFDEVYRGRDGVRRFMEEWKSGFGDFRYAVREIADAGGSRFAVRVELIGTIGQTGTELRDEYGQVNTVRDGRLIRQVNFRDWDEALAALAGEGG